MNYKQIFTSLLGLTISLIASAQTNLPTMRVGDKTYFYYCTENKSTVQELARKFNVVADDIFLYNPTVANGVAKNQMILLPASVDKTHPAMSYGTASMTYKLVDGDNLYTVAKKFNASVEDIVRNNVNIAPDEYSAGKTIVVNPNTAPKVTYSVPITKFVYYTLAQNDTYASLSSKFEIDAAELKALNPGMDKLKKGKKILVPTVEESYMLGYMDKAPLSVIQQNFSTKAKDTYAVVRSELLKRPLNVGVMLPFQLSNENAPRQAFLYTDFLKGMLLAVDSLGGKAQRPMNIKVYDTEHNLNVTDSLLALPEVRELNLIIAPSEPKQLERISNFGQKNNVNVLNCFATKNDDFKANPNVYITMTPTANMVGNVVSWFKTRFPDATVVYLMDKSAEPTDLFKSIKESLAGCQSISINVDGELPYAALDRKLDPGTSYVVIPSNGTKALLKKVLPALKKAKTDRFDCELTLLGYPEYVVSLKEIQADLMAVDTYMFSRFFNTKGFRTQNVENSYTKKYEGDKMINDTYPVMALYGFDAGCFLINTLGSCMELDDNTPVEKGIQTGFKFTHAEGWKGYINQAITMVHFSTDKKIESFVVINK